MSPQKKIFGDDVDIKEAIQLLHEKELEYKRQLSAGEDGVDIEEQGHPKIGQSTLGFDLRGVPTRYVPGKAAEAAKKVEWHASKAKKAPTPTVDETPSEKEQSQSEEVPKQEV
jgi:hypothetical protein